ncbi:Uncharacterised protein [Vibrio cholerae]|nr:Uncharacterised protein [Vibrio cholerae]
MISTICGNLRAVTILPSDSASIKRRSKVKPCFSTQADDSASPPNDFTGKTLI